MSVFIKQKIQAKVIPQWKKINILNEQFKKKKFEIHNDDDDDELLKFFQVIKLKTLKIFRLDFFL